MNSIISRLQQYLKQPFPYLYKRWLYVLIPTLWVFSIIIILQPLNIYHANNKLAIILIFAIVSAAVCFAVVYIFPLIFKKFFDPKKWTKGRFWLVCFYIMFILAFVFILIWSRVALYGSIEMITNPIIRFIVWYTIVFVIGSFPSLIIYAITSKHQLETINKNLLNYTKPANQEVTLSGGTKECLTLNPNNLLYAEVDGNYVTIFYSSEDQVRKKLLRITLLQILNQLNDFPHIVRSHRNFVVNTDKVIDIQGNYQSCILKLSGTDTEIPVSRSYIKEIRSKIK